MSIPRAWIRVGEAPPVLPWYINRPLTFRTAFSLSRFAADANEDDDGGSAFAVPAIEPEEESESDDDSMDNIYADGGVHKTLEEIVAEVIEDDVDNDD